MENNFNTVNTEPAAEETVKPAKKNIAAIVLGAVSLDVGIGSIAISWVPFCSIVGLLLAVGGLVTSSLSLKRDKRIKMAKIGRILSIIGIVLSVLFFVLWIVLIVSGIIGLGGGMTDSFFIV